MRNMYFLLLFKIIKATISILIDFLIVENSSPKKTINSPSPTKVKAKVDTGLRHKSANFTISQEERRAVCKETMSQLKMIEKLNNGINEKFNNANNKQKSPFKCNCPCVQAAKVKIL